MPEEINGAKVHGSPTSPHFLFIFYKLNHFDMIALKASECQFSGQDPSDLIGRNEIVIQ